MMKKLVAKMAATVLTLGTGGTLAFSTLPGTIYACEMANCLQTGNHTHSVCTVTDCTQSVNHEHDGEFYFAHYESDGHVYHDSVKEFSCTVISCKQTSEHGHAFCDTLDCEAVSEHEHDGVIYYGHHENDGHTHNYQSDVQYAVSNTLVSTTFDCGITGCNQSATHSHTACTVSGCNQMADHEHDGVIYYGHDGNDGHAYHNCGASGCTQTGSHTHNSCGVSGCNMTGGHNHETQNGGHGSNHRGRHH